MSTQNITSGAAGNTAPSHCEIDPNRSLSFLKLDWMDLKIYRPLLDPREELDRLSQCLYGTDIEKDFIVEEQVVRNYREAHVGPFGTRLMTGLKQGKTEDRDTFKMSIPGAAFAASNDPFSGMREFVRLIAYTEIEITRYDIALDRPQTHWLTPYLAAYDLGGAFGENGDLSPQYRDFKPEVKLEPTVINRPRYEKGLTFPGGSWYSHDRVAPNQLVIYNKRGLNRAEIRIRTPHGRGREQATESFKRACINPQAEYCEKSRELLQPVSDRAKEEWINTMSAQSSIEPEQKSRVPASQQIGEFPAQIAHKYAVMREFMDKDQLERFLMDIAKGQTVTGDHRRQVQEAKIMSQQGFKFRLSEYVQDE